MSKVDSYAYKNPYQFILNARKLLRSCGFVEFDESTEWDKSVNKFFVVRDDRSIIAVNKHDTSSALILATHNDSPCLKLKPNTKLSRFGYDQVRVAPYGVLNSSAWIDREMIYTGQILTRSETDPNQINRHVFATLGSTTIIPSLSKHLGGGSININQELHLQPIDSMKYVSKKTLKTDTQSSRLMTDIMSLAKCKDIDQIIDWDISLIPEEPTRRIGVNNEMLSGYAIDIIASGVTSLNAFSRANNPESGMNVLAVFDTYQITNLTRVGAKSDFLHAVLTRIGADETTFANTNLLSIDNFKGFNPNETNADESKNPSYNTEEGVYIRSESGRIGVTTTDFKARLLYMAKKAKIPLTPRNDTPQIASSIAQDLEVRDNMSIAVIGIPIIGFNSPRELAFNEDITAILKLVTEYFNNFRSIPAIQSI